MLIAMAVYDTEDNRRTKMTLATLRSLARTVDWDRHRLFVIDNASCAATQKVYSDTRDWLLPFTLLRNIENRGTAKAINRAWAYRAAGEHCVKMDNDVVIHQADWCDWMEDVFDRDPAIGICGLKRGDLDESPFQPPGTVFHSSIRMLPHKRGQRWLVVEDVHGVIGTCQGYNSALLDKIGFLVQPGVYGFDDSLASVRCELAGMGRVFLHGFEIEHIDPGNSAYSAEKRALAGAAFIDRNTMELLYRSGAVPIYHDYEV